MVTRVLGMARDWGLGMLAFGAVFLSAMAAGVALYLLAKAFLPTLPADDDDEAGA